MKPNIFDLATKELSQDAFLTWLLKWADPKNAQYDAQLNVCAKELISELIQTKVPDFIEEITKVEAGRQWKNIDVWVEVNNSYLIIIEDKTNTGKRANQLVNYRNTASKWCAENNYHEPICIYIKTGNESLNSLSSVKKDGYAIYNRPHLVKLLSKYVDIKNDIFVDFKERIIRLESQNTEYINKPLGKWGGADWQGFFQYLEKEIKIVNWNYVNNPAGGFWCAVMSWDYWQDNYPAYLQIEEGKLCFKISTNPAEPVVLPPNVTRSQVRNKLHHLLMSKAKEKGLGHIRRPDRFGSGNYMTVAVVDKENWLGGKEETINHDKVKQVLVDYRKFLIDAIK